MKKLVSLLLAVMMLAGAVSALADYPKAFPSGDVGGKFSAEIAAAMYVDGRVKDPNAAIWTGLPWQLVATTPGSNVVFRLGKTAAVSNTSIYDLMVAYIEGSSAYKTSGAADFENWYKVAGKDGRQELRDALNAAYWVAGVMGGITLPATNNIFGTFGNFETTFAALTPQQQMAVYRSVLAGIQ